MQGEGQGDEDWEGSWECQGEGDWEDQEEGGWQGQEGGCEGQGEEGWQGPQGDGWEGQAEDGHAPNKLQQPTLAWSAFTDLAQQDCAAGQGGDDQQDQGRGGNYVTTADAPQRGGKAKAARMQPHTSDQMQQQCPGGLQPAPRPAKRSRLDAGAVHSHLLFDYSAPKHVSKAQRAQHTSPRQQQQQQFQGASSWGQGSISKGGQGSTCRDEKGGGERGAGWGAGGMREARGGFATNPSSNPQPAIRPVSSVWGAFEAEPEPCVQEEWNQEDQGYATCL